MYHQVSQYKVFKQNKRGYYSFWTLIVIFVLSVLSPLLANNKPLILSYQGHLFFPIVQNLPDSFFGGNLPTEADYKDTFIRHQIKKSGWMIMPIIPYAEDTVDYFSEESFPTAPSFKHWLGTDDQGRDVLARLLYALRVSLIFGLILTILSASIGLMIGAIQGYFGGKTDLFIGRFLEIWGSLPQLFILMIVSSLIAPTFFSILFVLLLFSWPSLTGIVRAEFLKTRTLDYVRSAKGLGVSDVRIMIRHILPNAFVATLTYLPFLLAGAIVSLSALDFLGLGLPAGSASLGDLIRQGKDNLQAPWLGLTAFLVLTVLLSLLLFVGEALREVFDPHRQRKKKK